MTRRHKEEMADGITLYLGDCHDILPTLGKKVDTVVTSPPYNQMSSVSNAAGLWAKTAGGAGFVTNWKTNGYLDDLSEADYQRQQNELFCIVRRVCHPTASLFYNHQIRWRNKEMLHPIQWFKPHNWKLRSEIVWNRTKGMMLNARMFVRLDERILWFTTSESEWKWNQAYMGYGTVWTIPPEQKKKMHPVSYPLEVPLRCIRATTNTGDTILDPFMGSGTTGVAAIQCECKFIGIEIEPKYFDIACRRIHRELTEPNYIIKKPKPKKKTFDEIWDLRKST